MRLLALVLISISLVSCGTERNFDSLLDPEYNSDGQSNTSSKTKFDNYRNFEVKKFSTHSHLQFLWDDYNLEQRVYIHANIKNMKYEAYESVITDYETGSGMQTYIGKFKCTDAQNCEANHIPRPYTPYINNLKLKLEDSKILIFDLGESPGNLEAFKNCQQEAATEVKTIKKLEANATFYSPRENLRMFVFDDSTGNYDSTVLNLSSFDSDTTDTKSNKIKNTDIIVFNFQIPEKYKERRFKPDTYNTFIESRPVYKLVAYSLAPYKPIFGICYEIN